MVAVVVVVVVVVVVRAGGVAIAVAVAVGVVLVAVVVVVLTHSLGRRACPRSALSEDRLTPGDSRSHRMITAPEEAEALLASAKH